jgi:methyl-accepting chemotaxis protein
VKIVHSLKFRFIVFVTLFIIILCTVLTGLTIRRTIGTAADIFSGQGVALTKRAAALIDGDAFEALTKSLDENDPFYEETRLKLLALKQDSDCRFLYTMAPAQGDTFLFIIDGSTTPDDDENFSSLGDEEDISSYDTAFLKTMQTNTSLYSSLTHQDGWGWVISAYTPIVNSSGTVVGLVGCDFDAEGLYGDIVTQGIEQIILGVAFIAAGLALMLMFLRMIFKPLGKVSGILQEIAAGDGDLTKRFVI